MWLSESTATSIYDIANGILIISLMAGVAATSLVVWMGNVKEGYLKREVAAAHERSKKLEIARLELEGKAEKLQLDIVNANHAVDKTKLELAKFKAPRKLKENQRVQAVKDLSPFPGTSFSFSTFGAEEIELAIQIADVLKDAGWEWGDWPFNELTFSFPAAKGKDGKIKKVGFVPLYGIDIRSYDPKLNDARDMLVKVLKRNSDLEPVRGQPGPENIGISGLQIYIGSKRGQSELVEAN